MNAGTPGNARCSNRAGDTQPVMVSGRVRALVGQHRCHLDVGESAEGTGGDDDVRVASRYEVGRRLGARQASAATRQQRP
jgi:hypothetical protein